MELEQDYSDSAYQLQAYEVGLIRINATDYTRSLIVTPEQLIANWSPQSLQTLDQQHWDDIIALHPELVLLGTGTTFQMPATSLLAPLYQRNIGVECMDTGAACRTFVALVSEGRRVAAALLIAAPALLLQVLEKVDPMAIISTVFPAGVVSSRSRLVNAFCVYNQPTMLLPLQAPPLTPILASKGPVLLP